MKDEDNGTVILEAAGAEAVAVAEKLIEAVEEIPAVSDYRNAYKKQFCSWAWRIKLLAPMLEELKESKDPIPGRAALSLALLKLALYPGKELLRLGSEGRKIFLVCR